MNDKFKNAYVVQNTHHDFDPVKKIAENIIFVTNGYEEENTLYEVISKGLEGFNNNTDILIPVGNVVANFIAGRILGEAYEEIWLAIFKDKQYHLMAMNYNSMSEKDI
jgi:hypothetical protein